MTFPIREVPDTLPIEAWESFFHAFTHEIRNLLNGIALEAADLTEQAGAHADTVRLQKQVQECSHFLKTVRELVSFDPPKKERVAVADLINALRHEMDSGIALQLAVSGEIPPTRSVVVDSGQVLDALGDALKDAVALAAPGARVNLIWSELPEPRGVTLRVSFPFALEYDRVEQWGRALGAKYDPGLLLRYRIRRLLEQNGGEANWYRKVQENGIWLHLSFGGAGRATPENK